MATKTTKFKVGDVIRALHNSKNCYRITTPGSISVVVQTLFGHSTGLIVVNTLYSTSSVSKPWRSFTVESKFFELVTEEEKVLYELRYGCLKASAGQEV